MEEETESEEEGLVIKRSKGKVNKHCLSSSDSDNEIRRSSNDKITTSQSALAEGEKYPRNIKFSVEGSRSSKRLKSKNSRIFNMPSRDDIWGNIKSDGTRHLSPKKLSPKKLVNNFSRINNQYNAENIDVFEDSSLSDFINDSGDQSEQSTSDSESQKKHRVKNFVKRKPRSRIVENCNISSDSESDDNEKTTNISTDRDAADVTHSTNHSTTNSDNNNDALQKHSNTKHSDTTVLLTEDTDKGIENPTEKHSVSQQTFCADLGDSKRCDGDSFSDDDVIAVRKRYPSTSLLDSDGSSSENTSVKPCGISLRDVEKRSTEKKKMLFKGLKDARAKHLKLS